MYGYTHYCTARQDVHARTGQDRTGHEQTQGFSCPTPDAEGAVAGREVVGSRRTRRFSGPGSNVRAAASNCLRHTAEGTPLGVFGRGR